ncbi:unnamed protein product, partial [Owenia fusiformis]
KLTLLRDKYKYSDADVKMIIEILRFAKDEMSGYMRKSGRPYFEHCIGMAGCLLDVGAPLELALSGLVHSAYVFGKQAQDLTNADDICELRKRVVADVGLGVEYYLWSYTIFPRPNLGDSAMWIAREGIERGLPKTTKMFPRLRGSLLGHLCNELDEFYHFDQRFGQNRYRSQAFRENATYVLNKLGYPELAEKLNTLFAKHIQLDNPASEPEKQYKETEGKLAKKLFEVFKSSFKQHYQPSPRKFHRIVDFDKIDEHYILAHFDDHYGQLENLCPDIPLYEPPVNVEP